MSEDAKTEVPVKSPKELLETAITNVEKCVKAFELMHNAGAMTEDESIDQRTKLASMLCELDRTALRHRTKYNISACPWFKCMGLLNRIEWKEVYGRTPESIESGFRSAT